MATRYALPALVSWGATSTTNGWSNTSGGAGLGAFTPSINDDIVFDANSGPARAITLTAGCICRSITTVGSNAHTVSGALHIAPLSITFNGNTDISGFSPSSSITLHIDDNGYTSPTATLISGNCPLVALICNESGFDLTLGSNLVINGSVTQTGNSFKLFNAGFNLTCTAISLGIPGAAGGGNYIAAAGSTTTLTGTGTVFTTGGTVGFSTISATATFIINNKDPSLTKTIFLNSPSGNWGDLINDTGNGGAGLILENVGFAATGRSFQNVTLNVGTKTFFKSGLTTSVASLTADGSGGLVVINSTSAGTAATVAKTGGGQVNVNYCNIKDITASPVATFIARNSIDSGNNTNWNFIPPNNRFFSFL